MPKPGTGTLGLPHWLYYEIECYVDNHGLVFMLEFVIEEITYHRPKEWKPFLLATLDRYRKMRQQKRLLQRPEHLRHIEHHDFYCGTRSLRMTCEAAMYVLMHNRPADPIEATVECFDMPDDLSKLQRQGVLVKRHNLFRQNKEGYKAAHARGLLLEEDEYKTLHKRLVWFFTNWDVFHDNCLEGPTFQKMVEDIKGACETLQMPLEKALLNEADWDLNGDNKVDLLEYLVFMHDNVLPKDRLARSKFMHKLEQNVANWPKTLDLLVERGYVKSLDDPFREKLYTMFHMWDEDQDFYVDTKEVKKALRGLGLSWQELQEREGWEGEFVGRLYNHFEFVELLFRLWEGNTELQVTRALQLLQERVEIGFTREYGEILSPDEATGKMLELFDLWDLDKSGYLCKAEVEVMLVDLGDKNSRDILAACIMRPDGLVNRCDFVMFLRGLWKVKGPRTVDLALEAMRKKRDDANLTENIMAHYVNPDDLYCKLGELFDLWDADQDGKIQNQELAVVLRDIGLDPEALLTDRQHEALDREEFCEFLKSMWAGEELDTAEAALHALKQRMVEGNEVRKALEESGAIESSVAKCIAPKRVNELLKEVFILWDVDKSGHIELWELERLLKTLGGEFEGLIVEGFPDWLMQQVDQDGDAALDVDEFVSFLKGLWADKTVEQANAMLKQLRFAMTMAHSRFERLTTVLAKEFPDGMDRAHLQTILVCCPEGSWEGLALPPTPRAGKDPIIVPVGAIMKAIRSHIQNIDSSDAFSLLEHLEHKVNFGLSLLDASTVDRAIYGMFTEIDADLSGRMEVRELQSLLDSCGGGYAAGVMQLTDDDQSGYLDKLEFAHFLKEFWGVTDADGEKLQQLLTDLKEEHTAKYVPEKDATRDF